MSKRKIVFWGAGEMCRCYLKTSNGIRPEFILDNNLSKKNSNIENIPVIHPDDIRDYNALFIIVVSQYEKEIFQQLEGLKLVKNLDFIGINSLYEQIIPLELIKAALVDLAFETNNSKEDFQIRVNSKEEYDQIKKNMNGPARLEKALSKIYYALPGKTGGYPGYCITCGEHRHFQVDYFWSKSLEPAWRETVTCPVCHCNSRMRFVADLLLQRHKADKVFCYEYSTCTFTQLKKQIKYLIGSEYLGDDIESGTIIDGILHQNAMNLSFPDETFDAMVSCDVFEHVADYKIALQEAYRCLVPNGELIVSIPVFRERYHNVTRTEVDKNGVLRYLLEPVYHGNPISNEGSLVFQEFGWQFLDDLKEIGFSDVYAIAYYSTEKGYFGDWPIVFVASK